MFDFIKKAVSKVVNKLKKEKEEELEASEKGPQPSREEKDIELMELSKKGEEKGGVEKNKALVKAEKAGRNKRVEEKVEKRVKEKLKVGLLKKAKALITKKIKIEEKDISNLLEDFEVELIEADAAFEVAEIIKEELRKKLIGKEVSREELNSIVKEVLKETLSSIMPPPIDFLSLVRELLNKEKPLKIVFFGPNGSGKTTAIAKVANLLKNNSISVVIAASDTFRAAAIEQLNIHAERIGVKLIRGEYGSDPSSVAYNAIKHAEAKGVDVVLIDTAGRLEVDTNLMRELEKIVRVTKPSLKIFVVDSTIGNAAYDMVREYNDLVGIDGIILTKVDLDSKGGVVISLYKETEKPIFLVSFGQGYEQIESFDKNKFIDKILN